MYKKLFIYFSLFVIEALNYYFLYLFLFFVIKTPNYYLE